MRPTGTLIRILVIAGILTLTAALLRASGGDDPQAAPTPSTSESKDRSPDAGPPPSTPSKTPSRPPATGPVTWEVRTDWCGPASAAYSVTIRVTASASQAHRLGDFASVVHETLCADDSWVASGSVRFRFVPNGKLVVGLWSASETERECLDLIGLSVGKKYSCADSAKQEVVLNARAWHRSTEGWPEEAGLDAYRQMLVNHEVGHALRQRHRDCPGDGQEAPVMMQQSKGMNLNGSTCTPNPWPLTAELETLDPPSVYAS